MYVALVPIADANAPKLTDWLIAAGGIGAFVATALLAFVAWKQMGKLGDQVAATQTQVEVMREASQNELDAVRDQLAESVEQRKTIERQVDAAVQQGNAIRAGARAQLQPVVLADATQIVGGPNDEYSIREDQVAIAYFVANEGSGIALNIRHGIEIDGIRHEYGDGMQIRVLGPGESNPIRAPGSGQLIWRVPMFVVRPREEIPLIKDLRYWAHFESVFGEYFETVNPSRPDVPFRFRHIDHVGQSVADII